MTDAEFWPDRWQKGRTGWQEPAANGLLVSHIGYLGLAPGARVFVPLCGAAPDIGWLLSQGYRVAGAELSGVAIAKVFDGLGVAANVSQTAALRHHSAPGLDLFEGDIFDLTPEMLGPIDAVHDRAALFAMPPDVRGPYAAHLVALTGGAPQLLNCLDHDGGPLDGPPFSVPPEEVADLYGDHYHVTLLDQTDEATFRAHGARDSLWLLTRR